MHKSCSYIRLLVWSLYRGVNGVLKKYYFPFILDNRNIQSVPYPRTIRDVTLVSVLAKNYHETCLGKLIYLGRDKNRYTG